ncbi:hypothetical protein SAMN06298212_10149 [Ruaniaceae bacterium KH17]|nr:hypothetical protein SAMN06298212_10149 [Ruaniaceae bacterium KH17]
MTSADFEPIDEYAPEEDTRSDAEPVEYVPEGDETPEADPVDVAEQRIDVPLDDSGRGDSEDEL